MVGSGGATSTPVIGPPIKLRKFSFRFYEENIYVEVTFGVFFCSCECWGARYEAHTNTL